MEKLRTENEQLLEKSVENFFAKIIQALNQGFVNTIHKEVDRNRLYVKLQNVDIPISPVLIVITNLYKII